MKELKACAHGILQIPNDVVRRKERLVDHMLALMFPDLQVEIENILRLKDGNGEHGRKRRCDEEHIQLPARNPPHVKDNHDPSRYLDLPSDVEVKALYRDFYNTTSSNAVNRVVCGVCGREWGTKDAEVKVLELNNIPNGHRLKPEVPHPAHDLYDGMLLQPESVSVDPVSTKTFVNVCCKCGDELRLASVSPVSFSLANGLWIGPIPEEIRSLTFVEQLLVGHIRTKCYVFKLWPKSMPAGADRSTMQRAMRGTVTSYDLNVPGV